MSCDHGTHWDISSVWSINVCQGNAPRKFELIDRHFSTNSLTDLAWTKKQLTTVWVWLTSLHTVWHCAAQSSLGFSHPSSHSLLSHALVGSGMKSPQTASHLAVISAWWCHESLTRHRDGDFWAAWSPIMASSTAVSPNPHPLYLIDFEWAKLAINSRHGVINVRKKGGKQTDKFLQHGRLMVTIVWGVREGEKGLHWIMLRKCSVHINSVRVDPFKKEKEKNE